MRNHANTTVHVQTQQTQQPAQPSHQQQSATSESALAAPQANPAGHQHTPVMKEQKRLKSHGAAGQAEGVAHFSVHVKAGELS